MPARRGSPARLVYLDLDGYKPVSDRFRHAAGDAALQALAQGLSDNVRESDVVGRMGGDEFAVILAQADFATGQAKALALAAVIDAVGGDDTKSGASDASAVKLLGNVPVNGKAAGGVLRHKGWRAEKIDLPPLTTGVGATIIAPAEVEIE